MSHRKSGSLRPLSIRPTAPRSSNTSPRSTKPTTAKTADCTNLGTGKHYPCTQAEYDAINEADEPGIAPEVSALPTASVCGDWDRAVKPADMLIMCGDGSEGLTNIRWTSWSGTSATGTGTHFQRLCIPDCATGTHEKVPVTISLSGPVKTAAGVAFSNMTVKGANSHFVPLNTGQ